MNMQRTFLIKFQLLALVLASFFTVTACGSVFQPAPTPTPTHPPTPTSTPFPEIDLDMDLPEGDAEKGLETAHLKQCSDCHTNELHPSWGPRFTSDAEMPFILERGSMRIASPEYGGRATTDYEYVIESIFLPEAYIVPGEWHGGMPLSFPQRLTDQELADILAWMATLE
jgi:mono/diheme cytochrome c family protein